MIKGKITGWRKTNDRQQATASSSRISPPHPKHTHPKPKPTSSYFQKVPKPTAHIFSRISKHSEVNSSAKLHPNGHEDLQARQPGRTSTREDELHPRSQDDMIPPGRNGFGVEGVSSPPSRSSCRLPDVSAGCTDYKPSGLHHWLFGRPLYRDEERRAARELSQ